MTDNSPRAFRPISITLAPIQIAFVVCNALPASGLLLLLLALIDPNRPLSLPTLLEDSAYKDRKISQSLVQGLLVLSAFNAKGPQSPTQIALRLKMPRPTVHRYLRTLTKIGLVLQDADRGLYRLATLSKKNSVRGYGLLPLLFTLIDPERERSLVKLKDHPSVHPKASMSLIQGLTVLSSFGAQTQQSVTYVASHLDVTKDTAFWYLNTLKKVGLLEQNNETHEYRPIEL